VPQSHRAPLTLTLDACDGPDAPWQPAAVRESVAAASPAHCVNKCTLAYRARTSAAMACRETCTVAGASVGCPLDAIFRAVSLPGWALSVLLCPSSSVCRSVRVPSPSRYSRTTRSCSKDSSYASVSVPPPGGTLEQRSRWRTSQRQVASARRALPPLRAALPPRLHAHAPLAPRGCAIDGSRDPRAELLGFVHEGLLPPAAEGDGSSESMGSLDVDERACRRTPTRDAR
jgi:hypothetical protein